MISVPPVLYGMLSTYLLPRCSCCARRLFNAARQACRSPCSCGSGFLPAYLMIRREYESASLFFSLASALQLPYLVSSKGAIGLPAATRSSSVRMNRLLSNVTSGMGQSTK